MASPTNITSWERDGTEVIEVLGDLDIETAPVLARHTTAAIAGGRLDLVLDLRDVDVLDATGLAVLLNLKRRLIRRGGQLGLACGPRAMSTLRRSRLEEEFRVYRTPQAALSATGAARAD